MHDVKPLTYKSLDGISANQLKQHHDILYTGYVNKTNEIEQKLASVDFTKANPSYSEIRELKLEQTFTIEGIKLHEAYFANLGGDGKITGEIKNLINEDYGSKEGWKNDMEAAGMAARGWVVCCYDLDENKVKNYSLDAHNIGPVFNCITLVVLDVYEHAYFIDYATNRKGYLDAFFNNLNWSYANKQILKYNLMNLRVQLKAA